MFRSVAAFIVSLLMALSSAFGITGQSVPVSRVNASADGLSSSSTGLVVQSSPSNASSAVVQDASLVRTGTASAAALAVSISSSSAGSMQTQSDLLLLADDKYADGSVPLGDYKYVTAAPKKGYIYLCNVHKDNPGSMVNGPWMHADTWNYLQKIAIQGSISWPQAVFSIMVSGTERVLSGNGLPVGYSTGIFPVASTDPAAAYDPNPNTISVQTLRDSLPAHPVYSDTPYCMGGEVGVMTDGVPLFDGFDAGLRDAPAHELQDSCDGHPQGSGEYHYHSLSSCFKDINVETVLGFAYDGFPITGPEVARGKYLTTEDLDECHGITSEVNLDGKKMITYHYVMTRDFPYSASCFRGKPITTGPSSGAGSSKASGSSSGTTNQSQSPQGAGMNGPPQAALDACSGKSSGATCTISTPQGTLSGQCTTPPNASQLACIPH